MRARHWGWLLLITSLAHADQPKSPVAQPTFSTGLQLADPAQYQSIPLASAPLMGNLPAQVDMTSDFPPPGNQGQQGSCVGWAVGYGLKSFQARKRMKWPIAGNAQLFSPAYIFNQITQSAACQGSLYLDALNLLTREGAATLAEFAYDPGNCTKQPSAAVKTSARSWRAEFWRRVNQADVTEIKAQLAAGFPVLIGMVVDDAFQQLRGPAVYNATGGVPRGGHAMVVIGYDDNRQAFKVLNSWSTIWGDGGYGWIGYKVFSMTVREAYVVKDFEGKPNPAPQPQPTPQPTPVPVPPAPPTVAPSLDPAVLAAPRAQLANLPNGTPVLQISVAGVLRNAKGHVAQVVVRFGVNTPAGPQPLPAAPTSLFRDFTGVVATGTAPISILVDRFDLGQMTMSIPLTEFRAGGVVVLRASVYLDQFQIGQSNLGTAMVPAVQPMGAFCCDVMGNRRCRINPSPLRSGCFCFGQGAGFTCP